MLRRTAHRSRTGSGWLLGGQPAGQAEDGNPGTAQTSLPEPAPAAQRTFGRSWGRYPLRKPSLCTIRAHARPRKKPRAPLRYALSKNISRKGPQNCRSLGFARDDKGDNGRSVECRAYGARIILDRFPALPGWADVLRAALRA